MPSRAEGLALGGHALRSLWAERFATQRSIVEVVIIAAVCLLGIIATLPNSEEKVAALIAQRNLPSAISLLEEQAERGELSAYNAFSLVELYRQSGERDKAVHVLEGVLQRDPAAEWARSRLAELYRAAARVTDEMRVLREMFLAKPDDATRDRLVALYFKTGDSTGELQFLDDLEKAGLARSEDLQRKELLLAGAPSPTQSPLLTVRTQ